jgi:hypothetical protein
MADDSYKSYKPGTIGDLFRGAPFEANDAEWDKWLESLAVKVETGQLPLRDGLFIADLAGQRRGRDLLWKHLKVQ